MARYGEFPEFLRAPRLAADAPGLLAQLRSVEETPILSRHFESTVPGVYFTGLASAIPFGPVMRFLCGAGFTARRISRHIAAGARRSLARGPPVSAAVPGRPGDPRGVLTA